MALRTVLPLAVIFALFACDAAREGAPPAAGLGGVALHSTPAPGDPAFYARGEPQSQRLVSAVADAATTSDLAVPRMLVRSGQAAIEVDSLEPALARARELAARLAGHVGHASVRGGGRQTPMATLELRIPVDSFDAALAALGELGRVESVDVTAADVGEEFVDVTARIANGRRLEQRLIQVLAQRAGKLAEVLEVERELSRVREQLERYEGRRRYLEAHAATSTLAITLHEPGPLVGTAGRSVMGGALLQAWRNLVAVIVVLVQALGIVMPLGVLAAAGWWLVRRVRRLAPAPVVS